MKQWFQMLQQAVQGQQSLKEGKQVMGPAIAQMTVWREFQAAVQEGPQTA